MSNNKSDWKIAAWLTGSFLFCFFLPLEWPRFQQALGEGLALTRWYAREHVILCLIPAFFIAGAIATFVRQESVMRYLGPKASKPLAYGVASVSGTILAVCSCTVLPIFAGIWRMGAGLGPAVAFLYSGPAISALAIILTARILGFEIGLARAVGAITFAVVIGLIMAWTFRKETAAKANAAAVLPDPGPASRPLWKTASWLGILVAILIFSNWSDADRGPGLFDFIAAGKWILTTVSAVGLAWAMAGWFHVPWWKVALGVLTTTAAAFLAPGHALIPFAVGSVAVGWISATTRGEMRECFDATWEFTKLIAPLLIGGVFVAGFLLGQPGSEGLIPSEWIKTAVGGNELMAVFFSSLVGALMYFATLTEIPILQGLLGSGMGKGSALALLLAGPALSLPSILALAHIMGAKKTIVYALLVVVMATLTGWFYGNFIIT